MSGTNILNVFWEKVLVGQLWIGERRQLNFQYEESWLNSANPLPISIRLPLKKEICDPEATQVFFSNLLPEQAIRKALSEKLGVSEGNDFRLLVEVGGECAGALSLLPKGENPNATGKYRELPPDKLNGMIDNIPKRPLILLGEGVRLSLAGAQNKLPLYVEGQKIFLPIGFNSSSHILKPPIPQYKNTAHNEAFCMMLAKQVGLPVPSATIWDLGRHKAYLVERFDRAIVQGELRRIHQEDFCQALGFLADYKYESEGGPGYEQCFSLIGEYSRRPPADKLNLVKWTIFNFIIGNSDAHAKNLSLLFEHGSIRLAPFYDLMSTCIYPELHTKMAMKIGGKYDRKMIFGRHWESYANMADLPYKMVKSLGKEMSLRLSKATPTLAKQFVTRWGAEETILKIQEYVLKQSNWVNETI